MRSLPVPGADRRRRRQEDRQEDRFRRAYDATGERLAVAEDNLAEARTGLDKFRAAVTDGFLNFARKGDET